MGPRRPTPTRPAGLTEAQTTNTSTPAAVKDYDGTSDRVNKGGQGTCSDTDVQELVVGLWEEGRCAAGAASTASGVKGCTHKEATSGSPATEAAAEGPPARSTDDRDSVFPS